jgi:hypothetical protein
VDSRAAEAFARPAARQKSGACEKELIDLPVAGTEWKLVLSEPYPHRLHTKWGQERLALVAGTEQKLVLSEPYPRPHTQWSRQEWPAVAEAFVHPAR